MVAIHVHKQIETTHALTLAIHLQQFTGKLRGFNPAGPQCAAGGRVKTATHRTARPNMIVTCIKLRRTWGATIRDTILPWPFHYGSLIQHAAA